MSEYIIEIPDYVPPFDPFARAATLGEEIVRCRDCENFESNYSDGAMFGASVCWGWDNGHDYPCFTHPDGFCHRGTRRDA